MSLDVRLFPCRSDNYGFLVRDRTTDMVATVDSPDAEAILKALEDSGWGRLDLLLNTHWHPDHTEGNAALKAETGCEIVGPEEVARVAPLDRIVSDGDAVMLGETRFQVISAPGHTLGHVVFHAPEAKLAFVGDVLFALGCGRLFEGTPQQMFDSFVRFSGWPDDTAIWCAHEYTASNARYALTLDDRPEMRAHAEAIFAARERGEPTVPTSMGVERAFNPFVRAPDAETFGRLRAGKDGFTG